MRQETKIKAEYDIIRGNGTTCVIPLRPAVVPDEAKCYMGVCPWVPDWLIVLVLRCAVHTTWYVQ